MVTRLELTLTQEQFQELEQAKSLLSHICPEGHWADIISALARNFNDRKLKGRSVSLTQTVTALKVIGELKINATTETHPRDGTGIDTNGDDLLFKSRSNTHSVKEKNIYSHGDHNECSLGLQSYRTPKRPRQYISVKTKRLLLKKAGYRCEYHSPDSKVRCSSQFQLEIDHLKPWSLGGSNTQENLRVLCRKHNNYMAEKAGLIFQK